MAEPVRVTVLRGETVESEHRVHAVAVRDGDIVASAGDPDLVTFMRSAAKPIQALPLARAREDLDEQGHRDRVGVAPRRCPAARSRPGAPGEGAGHRGRPRMRAVRGLEAEAQLLRQARGDARAVPRGRMADRRLPPARPSMPTGRALAEVVRLAGTDEIRTGIDGCGVVTFALPLTKIAIAFGGVDGRVADAMRAHPELIRGPRAADTNRCSRSRAGFSGGAEALLCAASPDGLSLALKVVDGAQRALRPALGAFLGTTRPRRLGLRSDTSWQQSKRSGWRSASGLKKVLHKAVDRC